MNDEIVVGITLCYNLYPIRLTPAGKPGYTAGMGFTDGKYDD
jgi:hypothetical protein